MSRFHSLFASVVLLGFGLSSVASGARASVLYRCASSDHSIAYTSTTKGFTGCRVYSVDVDRAPQKPAPTASVSTGKWDYRENVKAAAKPDFSATVAGSASIADVAAITVGVASTAPTLAPAPAIDAVPAVVKPSPQVTTSAPPAPRILRGAVYKVPRANGITEYTNIKPAGGGFAVLFTYIATCVACDIHSKINFARTALNLDAYQTEIAAATADYGVDSALLRAVIHAESAFNPMAISSKGAQGLMQLMPDTAGDLGVTNAFDAAQNIRGGARYLGELLKDFNGDTQLATAAYNAGPAAVQKYHGVPPYDETQLYVQRVATLRDRYQKAL
jgi:soluble lytic murein transglycosylase-like protein